MYSIQFGNKTIPYTLTTSQRRKTLSISVDHYGVSVISPSDVDISRIESTLHKKAPWIIKQLSDFSEMKIEGKVRLFLSGEKLPYLGRHYRLKVQKTESDKPSFRFYQSRFYAELSSDITEAEHRDIVYPLYVNWIKERASSFAPYRMLT